LPKNHNVAGGSRWLKAGAAMLIAIVVLLWSVREKAFSVSPAEQPTSEVFSPAHASIGEAVQHFFGMRPEGVQPIDFPHKTHVETVELQCVDCHISVTQGAKAGIPDIRTCWGCHVNTATEHPEVKKILAYQERGEDIPWQRVYGWNDEAHVRFNHAPHVRANVECASCHGNVAGMRVAERVVSHTMGFCVDCHKQRAVSNDCQTCHY
jgi:hypothetical protein